MKTKFIAVFCFLLSGILFSQTTYHVAINGNDSNAGTQSSPFKTLQKAANTVGAGDTVLVHAGTYRNSDFDATKTTPDVNYANNAKIWAGSDLLRITNKHGSASAYITFKPYQNDVVTLEFDNNYGVLIKNSSYIKFIGFTVKGIADKIDQAEAEAAWGKYQLNGSTSDLATILSIDFNNPPAVGTDIVKTKQQGAKKPSYYNGRGIVVNGSHHVDILDNLIKDVTSAAIRIQQSDWATVKGNEVKNCTYWTTAGVGAITVAEADSNLVTGTEAGSDTDIKIKLINNYVHHNENRLVSWNPTKIKVHWAIDEGTGLFLTRNVASNGTGATGGGTDYTKGKMLIANNISAFNGASGIVCHFTNRVTIEHNTCYKNGTTNQKASGAAPGGIGVNASNDVDIRNNIIYATSDSWAIGKLGGTLTNIIRTKNIVYNEGGVAIHRQMSTGWTKEDPKLVNPDSNDFTIGSNSPAVNAGTTTIEVTDDYLGNLRNDGTPDVGAYEYSSTLSVGDVTDNVQLALYPNPTNGTIFIDFEKNQQNVSVQIVNLLGKTVFVKQFKNIEKGQVQFEGATGIYFLEVNSDNKTRVFKVIKK